MYVKIANIRPSKKNYNFGTNDATILRPVTLLCESFEFTSFNTFEK